MPLRQRFDQGRGPRPAWTDRKTWSSMATPWRRLKTVTCNLAHC
jgi:hypothetical protein